MGDFKTVFEPNKLKPVEEDIPKIKYDSEKNKFARKTNKDLDSLPTIMKTWYKTNKMVRISTYGGDGENGGDLACLFYSSGRAVLPILADVNYSKNYIREVHSICHNFKADMATFLLSRTYEDETEIKLRYTLADGANFNKYYDNLINSDYFKGRDKQSIISDIESAINERTELIRLGVDITSDDLRYNNIKHNLEKYYLDPRERKVNPNITGGMYEQYFWSYEMRQLPLDTGIFTIASLFNNPEWDIREEELGSNAPTSGDINYTTMIDQLLSRKMYGLDFFRLIANVTGFNIFLLTPKGELHTQKCVARTYTNVDIVSLTLRKIKEPKTHYESYDYNPDSPCVTILFERAHFETVGILHELDDTHQIQTIFSFYDPFIQDLIERSESKKEYDIPAKKSKTKTEEINYSKMSIEDIIDYLDNLTGRALSRKDLREQAKELKRRERSSSEVVKTKKLKDMTTDEAMEYLDEITPEWKDLLEEGVKPRDYARQMVKDAKKK